MHLNEIREKFPQAFKAYVEMLVEDCPDDFSVDAEGNLIVVAQSTVFTGAPPVVLTWSPTHRGVTMDVGSGWVEE